MTAIGYARVSTEGQNLQLQLDALGAAGVVQIFTEKTSGAKRERRELQRMLDQLRPGDVVTVWRLDRIMRSAVEFFRLMEQLEAKGVGFRSLTEAIDTSTIGGRLLMGILAIVAECERGIIAERTREGRSAARRAGRPLGGKPRALHASRRAQVRMWLGCDFSKAEIARAFNVSPNTVARCMEVSW